MSTPNFGERLRAACDATAPVCVGIDPRPERLPRPLRERFAERSGAAGRRATAAAVAEWAEIVLDSVAGVVPAVKPQVAFFEALGAPGVEALEATCAAARARGLIVVLDAKRGDIASTAAAYARATLDDDGPIAADAITLSPWLGRDTLEPFLEYVRGASKGIYVLVRTSNPGGGALQKEIGGAARVAGWVRALNQEIAGESTAGPVGAVVGATVPAEAGALRDAMPRAGFLVPGYGAQGGGARDTLPCFLPGGRGALVNSSRGATLPGPGEIDEYDADPGAVIRRRSRAFAADIGGLFA